MTMVLQAADWAVAMVRSTSESPAQLRAAVSTPGGTTAAALDVLDAAGMGGALHRAVLAAANRSAELGRRIADVRRP
jgi:pyrroline-5-carboxylate reductase